MFVYEGCKHPKYDHTKIPTDSKKLVELFRKATKKLEEEELHRKKKLPTKRNDHERVSFLHSPSLPSTRCQNSIFFACGAL